MIRHLFALGAALLAGCTSHQGRPSISKPQQMPQTMFTVAKDITYTPANWPAPLRADIYTPAGSGPFPAILMVHGGGWNGRTRDDMDRYSQLAAKRGYVVMNVSYRLAPAARFPAQLQDLQQAVLWLRANAANQNVRSDRIGAWGYSAGAHLATLLAVTGPGDKLFVAGTRVQAVVGGGTPVDLRNYPDGPLVKGLMGVSLADDPELWRIASPIALVTRDDPPMFLYHGTFDYTVKVSNAHAMYDALSAVQVPGEIYLVRGLEHLTTFWINAPAKHSIDFLDRYLR